MPKSRWPLILKASTVLFLCSASLRPVQALDPRDFAVLVSARVQAAPAQITLEWPLTPVATGYILSRKVLTDQGWSALAQLPGNATSFTDRGIVAGAAYEYELAQTTSDGVRAFGYIYAGIAAPFAGDRGRVVLVVDSTYASDLGSELELLKTDLIGDGWMVLRHDVARSASPLEVKSVIQSDFWADPQNTKAVFLFGHVPVPYSGDLAPDEHANHKGAWPADVFYGDMEGTWTDNSVWDTDAEDPRNFNTPGDGRFDQSEIPGRVAVQVGRVDFADLPAFAPRSELDLLRQYLAKNHRFRHRLFDVARRGLIRDNFGEIEGDAPATDAWRSFASFFGNDVNAIGPGDFFPLLDGSSYLWAYGGGGGEYYQADGVGSTTDFANHNPQCVFFMLHGSYFGDWDSSDNFLRAALASSGYGLAAAWTGLPHWFLHHMALGETIGLSTQLAQNNRGLYKNQVNLSPGQVHIALMGDPTLRMHMVAPPGNLTASPGADGSVSLSWSPSSDAVQGYYVYRAQSASGPFSRVTRRFVTETSYTDAAVPQGPKTYMVRAVKLETSASGSYYNPSQGVFAGSNSGGGQALPVVSTEATNPVAKESGPVEGAFTISRSAPLSYALQVDFTIGGTAINGVDYQPISSSVVLPENSATALITVRPIPDELTEGAETVTLTVLPNEGYIIGSSASASVLIEDAPVPVNQPPTISALAPVSTPVNTSSPLISFTVADSETSPANLIVTAVSSNADLVPPGNIRLGGADQNRTLSLIPASDQTGTSTITVSVSDGVNVTSASFVLTVFGPGRIYSVLRNANGAASISFDGTAGRGYLVLASKDLNQWTTVQSGVFESNSPVTFLDSQSVKETCRFYRVQWQ